MGTHEDRTGRRRWLVTLASSCVLLLVALTWELSATPRTPTPDAAGWIVAPAPGDGLSSSVPAPSAAAAASGSGSRPLWSSRPANASASAVRAARPRRLVISRLGISMPVVAAGVTSDGEMDLPDHPQQVGWYRYGPQPGDPSGSVVLGGHVDSRRYGIGPLAALGNLRRDDRIVVQQATGQQVYRVRSVQLVSKRTLPVSTIFDRDGPAVLRILTCGGPYDAAHGGYRDNLVVTAVPS